MRTKCGHCELEFDNPTKAAKHVTKKHEAVQLKESKGQPVFRVTWNKTGVIRQVREDNG